MRIALIFTLSSACIAVVLVGYILSARRAKRKIVVQEKDESWDDGGQATGQPEPSAQPQVLEPVRLASSSTIDISDIDGSLREKTPDPAGTSVETAIAAPVLESVRNILEPTTTLTATEEPCEIAPQAGVQPTQATTEKHEEPTVEFAVPAEVVDSKTTTAPDETDEDSPERGQRRPPQKPRHISPEKRGGRARTEPEEHKLEQAKKGRPRTPRPEIVCWKREREWILAVEAPEELTAVSVLQNGIPLKEDEFEKDCWQLVELHGEVNVFTGEDEDMNHFNIKLGDENCLVFKLSGKERNQGRHVKQPAYGSFLVVVPADWERDEEKAGPALARPEYVRLEGYRAHFFNLDADSERRIALQNSIRHSLVIGSSEARFQLVGQELRDASENAGPLFGCVPPRIRIADGNWEDVETIVLGEEGTGRGRWRMSFKPNPSLAEQDIPPEIISREAGWYFVRFYDSQDELIDSLDFRFSAGLERIAIQQNNPLPSPDGHGVLTVEFQHGSHWYVRDDPPVSGHVEIERIGGKTILRIPPQQEWDRTHWLVGVGSGAQVEVTILADRVWWALSKVNVPPTHWLDTSFFLPRQSFAATSEEVVWLRFPKPRWIDRFFVGFQQSKWREYVPKVEENKVAIALRDFSDSQELANRTEDHALKAWIKLNTTFHEITIATVAAEPVEALLNVALIPACQLARMLTALGHATQGPLHQLVKEVRRKYRRSARFTADHNVEFVKEALCTISVFVQLAEVDSLPPRCARRWRSRARRADQQFPETMRQVWRRYRELEGLRAVELESVSTLCA